MLPKMEVLIMLVFFVSFFGWGVQRCSQSSYEQQAVQEEEALETAPLAVEKKDTVKKPAEPKVVREKYTPLYVTIENLNLREQPDLKSKIFDRLKLFDEVTFMDEVTDFTQEINLGEEVVTEPWIKVKSKKGKVGWVFGGGVQYYKTRRQAQTTSE